MAGFWTEERMQIALTSQSGVFNFLKYSVVPNISYSLLNHEADLLCLSRGGVFHEIEIKVSLSDLKADRKKQHCHMSKIVPYLWFAVPIELCESAEKIIPERAGIITVEMIKYFDGIYLPKSKIYRRPKKPKEYNKPSDKQIIIFLRMGTLRMWSRKENNLSEEYEREVINA
jgi:hypothetical protein